MPLSLVALAIGLYLPSLDNQFLYDDHEIILSNPPLSSFGDLLQIFRERHFPRVPYYRPITRTTFLLQKTLHGDRPEPFHLVNFLLLAATGLLAYALLQLPQFQVQPVPALLASALFVVHPVASSCVYPICSGRETLLPTALTLAALYALLRAGSAWYATAVALFVLSLFAKEQMVVVPALFVVADLLRLSGDPPGRDLGRWLRRYAPFPLILVGYLVIRHDLFGGTEYRFSDGSEVPFAFLYALQTIVAPFYQLIYEPSREVWLSAVRLLLSVAVMLGLGWAYPGSGNRCAPRPCSGSSGSSCCWRPPPTFWNRRRSSTSVTSLVPFLPRWLWPLPCSRFIGRTAGCAKWSAS